MVGWLDVGCPLAGGISAYDGITHHWKNEVRAFGMRMQVYPSVMMEDFVMINCGLPSGADLHLGRCLVWSCSTELANCEGNRHNTWPAYSRHLDDFSLILEHW